MIFDDIFAPNCYSHADQIPPEDTDIPLNIDLRRTYNELQLHPVNRLIFIDNLQIHGFDGRESRQAVRTESLRGAVTEA